MFDERIGLVDGDDKRRIGDLGCRRDLWAASYWPSTPLKCEKLAGFR